MQSTYRTLNIKGLFNSLFKKIPDKLPLRYLHFVPLQQGIVSLTFSRLCRLYLCKRFSAYLHRTAAKIECLLYFRFDI